MPRTTIKNSYSKSCLGKHEIKKYVWPLQSFGIMNTNAVPVGAVDASVGTAVAVGAVSAIAGSNDIEKSPT